MGALFLLFPSSLHPPPSHPLLLSTPMTKDGLDGAIERYLARTFGERVDFALERGLGQFAWLDLSAGKLPLTGEVAFRAALCAEHESVPKNDCPHNTNLTRHRASPVNGA